MEVMVQGILLNPLGEPIPNQEIRITTKVTQSTVKGTLTIYMTDEDGNYGFPLLYGVYDLEVLVSDTYKLTGDLRVDESTLNPIDLETLVQYSIPVVPEDSIDYPSDWDDKFKAIEDAAFTRKRQLRDQIVDEEVTLAHIDETQVDTHLNARFSKHTRDLVSKDAHVQHEDAVLSDSDDGTTLASIGSVIEALDSKKETLARVESDLITTIDINKVGSVSVERSESLSTGYTQSEAITAPNTDSTSSVSHSGTTISEVESKNSDDIIRQVLTLLSDNGIDQSQIIRVVSADQANGTESSESTMVQNKVSSVSHSNTGSASALAVNVDNFSVQDGSDITFEVDTVNDIVHVRGQLRVSKLEDADGNPIDPSDGDTIFLAYQYSENATGPWHDDRLPTDNWARQALSTNGVIAPWGAPYRISPIDGNNGDTIYWQYQYSPDGIVDWSPILRAGDAFRREREVVNGVGGTWSIPERIKGNTGDSIEIRSEYSIDGVYLWHDVLDPADKFERKARFVNGVIDTPWSNPFPIGKGVDGLSGTPGSGWYYIVNGTGVFPSNAQAVNDMIAKYGRAPVLDDHIFYVDLDEPNTTKSDGKRCISPFGTPVGSIDFADPAIYVEGDVIVKGTLSADRIVAKSITGNEVSSATTMIAGAGSWTSGMNGDDSAGAGIYRYWRFWAGSDNPAISPFRIDRTGAVWASNAVINGSIVAGVGNNIGAVGVNGAYRIWAGNVDPALAPFSVQQSGRVKIQSSPSGDRLVLDNDRIDVFNGNTLRIRIGRL